MRYTQAKDRKGEKGESIWTSAFYEGERTRLDRERTILLSHTGQEDKGRLQEAR